ncbi:MAG: C-terminal binding protein, partial [Deltaproteobacteria bacterium]|nr:C-terminal binding protein [Deltaproteobacteria bacterium]
LFMPRHTVAVTDHLFPSMDDEARMFREMDTELAIGQCKGEDEVIALCRNADAVLNTYARMTPRVIESLERCKVIVRFGIGYDNVDVEAATRCGVMVANTTEYCIDEVADQAMAMLLACARGLFPAARIARDGTWDLAKMPVLRRLRGQTLGLVGIGQIGKAVAARAHGFGLKVVASDPYVDEAAARELGAKLVDLDTLLGASDYVSVHVPLMPATEGMMNAAVFAKMKPTAFLINVARGRIVNQAELVRAVEQGNVAGAGLDVLEQEPCAPGDAIATLDNVILTPHSAWYSEEARADMRRRAVGQVVSVLNGELPYSLINREVVHSTGGNSI